MVLIDKQACRAMLPDVVPAAGLEVRQPNQRLKRWVALKKRAKRCDRRHVRAVCTRDDDLGLHLIASHRVALQRGLTCLAHAAGGRQTARSNQRQQ